MSSRSIIDKSKITKEKEPNVESTINEQVQPQTQEPEKVQEKPQRKKLERLDENLLVTVASRAKGGLIYVSPRTKIPYRFDDYGYENVMELSELRNMLSSQRKFFERGWIEVLDEEVIEYLKLERFQKTVVDEEDIDYIFNSSSPQEIKALLSEANTNTKRIVFGFAREKFVNGELINVHVIDAIESSLNQKLNPNK